MTTPSIFNLDPPTDGQSPLRRFKGVLNQVIEENIDNSQYGRANTIRAKFDFTDVEVLESVEPYTHPIATLRISPSKNSNTSWAVFTESVRKATGLQGGSLNPVIGKMQEWHYGPCSIRQQVRDDSGTVVQEGGREKWAVQPGNAWQVVSVEGFANAANDDKFNDVLLDLINGKTEEEFSQALFNQSELKSYSEFTATVNRQLKRELLPMLADAGLIKKNTEGVWSKV